MSHPPETSICNCNPYGEIGPTEKALNCPIHGVKAVATPPETSLSSRELAVTLADKLIAWTKTGTPMDTTALEHLAGFIENRIDAWVRVREAEVRLDESTIWRSIVITSSNFPEQALRESKTRIHQLEFALATARKQLKGASTVAAKSTAPAK